MSGDFDAGEGDLGDGLSEPVPSPARKPPTAVNFDPTTRRHVMNADGTFAGLHPVDAQVVNALFIWRGKLRSALNTGVRYREIPSGFDPRAESMAADMTRQALADLIKRKDISLESVKLRARAAGAIEIFVEWINNHLPTAGTQSRALPL